MITVNNPATTSLWNTETTSFTIPTHMSEPPAPEAGYISFFIKRLAGRLIPAFAAPTGRTSVLQPHMGRIRAVWWQPLGNTANVPLNTGIGTAVSLGLPTARLVGTANVSTRIKRLGFVSTPTAGQLCGVWWASSSAQYTTGDGAGLGGFTMTTRIVTSDVTSVAGARCFIGMSSNTAVANVEPSTLVNGFGFAQLSTDDTQWYFVYGGSESQTAVAMGTALGSPALSNTAWDITLSAFPGSTFKVGYEITNLGTGVMVEGLINGDSTVQMPPSTMLLAPRLWRCNNATPKAVGLDIASIYIETDL